MAAAAGRRRPGRVGIPPPRRGCLAGRGCDKLLSISFLRARRRAGCRGVSPPRASLRHSRGRAPPGAATHALQGAAPHTWPPLPRAPPPTGPAAPPARDSMDSKKLHQRPAISAPPRPSRPEPRRLTPGTLPYPAPRAHNRRPPRHCRPQPHATSIRSLTPTSSRRPRPSPFTPRCLTFLQASSPSLSPFTCPEPTQRPTRRLHRRGAAHTPCSAPPLTTQRHDIHRRTTPRPFVPGRPAVPAAMRRAAVAGGRVRGVVAPHYPAPSVPPFIGQHDAPLPRRRAPPREPQSLGRRHSLRHAGDRRGWGGGIGIIHARRRWWRRPCPASGREHRCATGRRPGTLSGPYKEVQSSRPRRAPQPFPSRPRHPRLHAAHAAPSPGRGRYMGRGMGGPSRWTPSATQLPSMPATRPQTPAAVPGPGQAGSVPGSPGVSGRRATRGETLPGPQLRDRAAAAHPSACVGMRAAAGGGRGAGRGRLLPQQVTSGSTASPGITHSWPGHPPRPATLHGRAGPGRWGGAGCAGHPSPFSSSDAHLL